MKDWFFIIDQGKTVGPLTIEDVGGYIQRGQLGPFDLLYRDGDERWQATHEFKEFRPLFHAAIKPKLDDLWVVLLRKVEGANVQYVQKGPLATQQVKDLLSSGAIHYRDFIWREGQKQWARISAVELFNPAPVKWEPAAKLPQDVQIKQEPPLPEMLEDVITKTDIQPLVEAKPSEAAGEDLTKTTITPSLNRSVPRSPSQPLAQLKRPRPTVETEEKGPWVWDLEPVRRLPLLKWSAVVIVLGIAGVLYFHREEIMGFLGPKFQFETKKEAPEASKPPAQAAHPAPKPQAAPLPAASAPVPVPVPLPTPKAEVATPPAPRVIPTRLSARVSGATGQRPLVSFSTNGSYHFPIQVTLIGEAGDVLDQVTVFRQVTVRWSAGESPSLDLGAMKLGEGRYQLTAKTKDIESEIRFRLGRDNKEFRSKIERHRKLISLPFQRERRRLIKASAHLAQLSQKLKLAAGDKAERTAWRQQGQDWLRQDLGDVNVDNPQSLVFPQLWQSLRADYQELVEWSRENGGQNDDLRRLVGDIAGLQEKCRKLALFKN